MILLQSKNPIVEQILLDRFEMAAQGEFIATELSLSDFDGCQYNIRNPGTKLTLEQQQQQAEEDEPAAAGESDANKRILLVSMRLYGSTFRDLIPHGVQDVLKREYGPFLVAPEDGNDVTLRVDLTDTPENIPFFCERIALLRRITFGSIFERYFAIQRAGGAGGEKATVLNYRPNESLHITALKDRVTVIFSTIFKDEDEIIIGKIFLQEFKEGRKGANNAPQVLFSYKDPPKELIGTNAAIGDTYGYVTFVLFARHTTEKAEPRSVDLIHTFRNYLHYHIKCSKGYLHSRMRAKTTGFLQVLNRARPESEVKEKKTASGKSFMQKGPPPPVPPAPKFGKPATN